MNRKNTCSNLSHSAALAAASGLLAGASMTGWRNMILMFCFKAPLSTVPTTSNHLRIRGLRDRVQAWTIPKYDVKIKWLDSKKRGKTQVFKEDEFLTLFLRFSIHNNSSNSHTVSQSITCSISFPIIVRSNKSRKRVDYGQRWGNLMECGLALCSRWFKGYKSLVACGFG
jgi:hypothetical protein